MDKRVQVAAYYFPNYHVDPLNERWHGRGWTEWDLVTAARPRFPGHDQPKTPAWGCFDESDPAWTAREIDLAAEHGIDAFIYDWYWYDCGPYLGAALDRGYLHAANRRRVKFALMWANHDWLNLHPANFVNRPETLARHVSPAQCDQVFDHIVQQYFTREEYWRIEGKPYFSIYEIGRFVQAMGGWDAAAAKLDRLRDKARAVGQPGIHLNVVVWGLTVLPNELQGNDPAEVVRRLGADSATTYAWVHHYNPNAHGFPRGSYAQAAEANYAAWERYRRTLGVPYHPNVSMGWDPSPRCVLTDRYEERGYPWTAILDGNTPVAFGQAVARACQFARANDPANAIVTVNAWNEWTEGSYLLPDVVHGLDYLQALREHRS